MSFVTRKNIRGDGLGNTRSFKNNLQEYFLDIRLRGYGRVNDWAAHYPPFNYVGSVGFEGGEPALCDQNCR
jgi:hypothetical protein